MMILRGISFMACRRKPKPAPEPRSSDEERPSRGGLFVWVSSAPSMS